MVFGEATRRVFVVAAGVVAVGAGVSFGWWAAGPTGAGESPASAAQGRDAAAGAKGDRLPSPQEAAPTSFRIASAHSVVEPEPFGSAPAVMTDETADVVDAAESTAEAEAPAVLAMAAMPVPRPDPRGKARDKSVLSDADIEKIKGLLALTPEQEKYWPAVEAELKEFAKELNRKKARNGGQDTEVTNVSETAVVQRLSFAAAPLIMRLSSEQKKHARMIARSVGLEKVASAF